MKHNNNSIVTNEIEEANVQSIEICFKIKDILSHRAGLNIESSIQSHLLGENRTFICQKMYLKLHAMNTTYSIIHKILH